MSEPTLILLGAGGHARACIDVVEQQGKFRIVGLVGLANELHAQCLGYPVIATNAELPQLARTYNFGLIAVGQIKSPDSRTRLYQQAVEAGFRLPTIIAPTAHVSRHATLGAGTIVMHGAIVNAGARVGDNCIINTRAVIEHDAVVEGHCHISTGAIVNGSAKVGAGSFVGSGSVIREGVSLGISCVVGMGLAVRHDQPEHTQLAGTVK